MGGGLMQLVAYGAQDVYLTGNPQITFFKVVYRRHTNFACEAIEQTFNGTPAFNSKATVPITRNGDLVTKMWLHTTVSCAFVANDVDSADQTVTLVADAGNALINSVELQIGGTKIDKHYGRWMSIWSDLSRTNSQDANHYAIVGGASATAGAALVRTNAAGAGTESTELFVPLQFFCCRNDGLALPLIALQYHDVRLEFEFNTAANIFGATVQGANTSAVTSAALSMSNTTLLVNYVYLDSEERKRFAQASHEYLIEQLQFTGVESVVEGNNKVRLNFNHPVKELVWAMPQSTAAANAATDAQKFNNYSTNADVANTAALNATKTALLQLNGHDRFSVQNGKFFNRVQPSIHHTRSPALGVNVYSFALNAEDHQPSGTCNFSRIDNATLNINVETVGDAGTDLYIYGVNYNVLRVMSGMGGVAYSN